VVDSTVISVGINPSLTSFWMAEMEQLLMGKRKGKKNQD
jgi:hypothetical protein